MMAITKFMLRVAVVVAFASALSPLVFGQSAEIENAKRAELERRAGENERRLSTWELRMAEVRRPPERRRDPSLAYTQIREDYKQIQIVNNDLARLVSAGGTLDFNLVEKSVSEIKRRAARLKENLMLPEPKSSSERPGPEVAAEAEQLKSALPALDKLVLEFVNNPIFEQAKAVNVQMAAKARRALEEIIEVSDRIKKSSEKLKKLAGKTQ
jgi:hypothetical protein